MVLSTYLLTYKDNNINIALYPTAGYVSIDDTSRCGLYTL